MMPQGIADALGRIELQSQDVLGGFEAGFEPVDGRSRLGRGASAPSFDPLSVVGPDGSYFVTENAGGVSYSRDGSFTFDDGTLRARDGAPVLGYGDGKGPPMQLRADPLDVALRRIGNPRIDRDGTLSYERSSLDPRTAERRFERVRVGRVALARFPAGTQPVRRDALHVVAPRGVAASLARPGESDFGFVTPFARDLGRVDMVAGLERLQEAYLSYEALRSAGQARVGLERSAMDLVK
jgi:flagellar basal body rod protein FlgG